MSACKRDMLLCDCMRVCMRVCMIACLYIIYYNMYKLYIEAKYQRRHNTMINEDRQKDQESCQFRTMEDVVVDVCCHLPPVVDDNVYHLLLLHTAHLPIKMIKTNVHTAHYTIYHTDY